MRQVVAIEVRKAYYGWLLAKVSSEILEECRNKLKEAEKKLIKMLDEFNEEVTDRDLFKLRYHASQFDALILHAEQGTTLALSALTFLTGIQGLQKQKPLLEIPLEASIDDLATVEDYFKQAQDNRPELRRLKAALVATQTAMDIQKASFYPDFFVAGYLEGSYSPAHDFIENSLLKRGLTYYDVGLFFGLRIILDIPQKMARLEKATADLATIKIQTDQAKQALRHEIDKHFEELQSVKTNLKIQKEAYRSAKAWMQTNFMSYGIGVSNTKDLLDSLAAYTKARLDLYKAHYDSLTAIDALDAAIGKDISRTP